MEHAIEAYTEKNFACETVLRMPEYKITEFTINVNSTELRKCLSESGRGWEPERERLRKREGERNRTSTHFQYLNRIDESFVDSHEEYLFSFCEHIDFN